MDAIWIVMIAVVATLLSVFVGMRTRTTPLDRRTLFASALLGLVVLAGLAAYSLLR
jgi:small basic protein